VADDGLVAACDGLAVGCLAVCVAVSEMGPGSCGSPRMGSHGQVLFRVESGSCSDCVRQDPAPGAAGMGGVCSDAWCLLACMYAAAAAAAGACAACSGGLWQWRRRMLRWRESRMCSRTARGCTCGCSSCPTLSPPRPGLMRRISDALWALPRRAFSYCVLLFVLPQDLLEIWRAMLLSGGRAFYSLLAFAFCYCVLRQAC
jgi:hypothetical protein